MWLGSRLGIAARWALGAGLLALGAAVALLAAWRYRGRSACFELNRQQWSGQTGCLGLLGLFGGLFIAQILSDILANSGAGLLPQIGLAVVFGLALWLGMRAWTRCASSPRWPCWTVGWSSSGRTSGPVPSDLVPDSGCI
ncbi:UNVERIFIED_CONTAM: hypothetical protein RF649_00300 [Kocuria sp. CPCC 205295]|uniref:hypothetical protein n=1 Tax=unclassified Kocuria TaxID=2649579 RepID=UPI0034D5BB56